MVMPVVSTFLPTTSGTSGCLSVLFAELPPVTLTSMLPPWSPATTVILQVPAPTACTTPSLSMVATYLSLVVYLRVILSSPVNLIPSCFSCPALRVSFLFSGSVKMIYLTLPLLLPLATTVSLTGPDGRSVDEELLLPDGLLEEELLLPLLLEEELLLLLLLEELLPEELPPALDELP